MRAAGLARGTNGQMQHLRKFCKAEGNSDHRSFVPWFCFVVVVVCLFPKVLGPFLLNVETLCLKVKTIPCQDY